MLARFLRLIVALWLGVALLWGLQMGLHGHIAWAAAGVVFVLLLPCLALGAEFLFVPLLSRGDPTPRASAAMLLLAWGRACASSLLVFAWWQPFFSRRYPDTAVSPLLERGSRLGHPVRAVVLIHGFLCNRGFWQPVMRRLRGAAVPYVSIDLEPVFAHSIDDYVPLLDRAVEQARAATGGLEPVIVAHSMGGLVARAWRVGASGSAHRIVTVGTPHGATAIGRLARLPTVRQMTPGSPWLAALRVRERAATSEGRCHAEYVCFYGNCDNVVMPPSAAMLDGADNRLLDGCAHVEMAFREEVLKEVLFLSRSV